MQVGWLPTLDLGSYRIPSFHITSLWFVYRWSFGHSTNEIQFSFIISSKLSNLKLNLHYPNNRNEFWFFKSCLAYSFSSILSHCDLYIDGVLELSTNEIQFSFIVSRKWFNLKQNPHYPSVLSLPSAIAHVSKCLHTDIWRCYVQS